jgi:NADH dehydrogenase (ubiquinone) Fe-S protein 5
MECLHHAKEAKRAKAIQDEFIRQAELKAQEGQKTADILADGVIVGVGLIKREGKDEAK